ncbi:MAG: hypothetical protein VX000_14915 [Myxococcota bacterium]|nr:hypothetical protein [Myxococcota bacterium]
MSRTAIPPALSGRQPLARGLSGGAARRRVTGEPRTWGHRLAWLGGASALLVSLPFSLGGGASLAPGVYALVAGVLGAGSGWALGRATPAVLDRVRGRVPLWALALLAPVVGAVWGGSVGAAAGLISEGGTVAALGLIAGSCIGALQVGLWWFPLVFQTVRGERVWPVLLGSVLLCPLLPMVAFWFTFTLVRLVSPAPY